MENGNLGQQFLESVTNVFQTQKRMAEAAVTQISDEKLHASLDPNTNCLAVIMKHVSGNLRSRWTDFLTSDGEKSWRQRDDEFLDTFEDRAELLAYWEQGWQCLFETLESLTADDLTKTVSIRGEPHSVPLALQRSLGHTCYHVGQIVQVARIQAGEDWTTLTISPGDSERFNRENWGPLTSPNE